jgi:trans-aconitate methyltransferase
VADQYNLDQIAVGYDPSNPAEQFDYWLKRLQARTLLPWLHGGSALELGCATGELAMQLVHHCEHYTIVEGSSINIDAARDRLPGVSFIHSMWEDYTAATLHNDIILFNALEHVEDPVGLLRRSRAWLAPRGRIHIVVPNGLSIHRLVGTEMDFLPNPLAVTDGDRAQGHVRNYTVDLLSEHVRAAGFAPIHQQGIFLKVLSNRQMLGWDWDLIQALHNVASRFVEHAAELFVSCELPTN